MFTAQAMVPAWHIAANLQLCPLEGHHVMTTDSEPHLAPQSITQGVLHWGPIKGTQNRTQVGLVWLRSKDSSILTS